MIATVLFGRLIALALHVVPWSLCMGAAWFVLMGGITIDWLAP